MKRDSIEICDEEFAIESRTARRNMASRPVARRELAGVQAQYDDLVPED